MELTEFNYLKELERSHETYIERNRYIVARLDGHGFSKFTRGCIKPFDTHLSEAMKVTTEALMKKFNASYAFTQSDEISLVWEPRMDRNGKGLIEHPHSGRVVKLATLMASHCSLTFAEAFPYTEGTSYSGFDARVYGCDKRAAFDSLKFRFIDAAMNAYQMIAQSMWSQKELNGVSVQQIKAKLVEADMNPFEKYGDEAMMGVYFYKLYNEELGRQKIVRSNGGEMMKQIKGLDFGY